MCQNDVPVDRVEGVSLSEMLLADARDLVVSAWSEGRGVRPLRDSSVQKYTQDLDRFVRYAHAHGVELVGQATPAFLDQWMRADGRSRRGQMGAPSDRTIAGRHQIVARFHRELRFLLGIPDPAARLASPKRLQSPFRHLTPQEVERVLFASASTPPTARLATVALALCGAHSVEIGGVTAGDLTAQAEGALLSLPGGARVRARIVPVPPELWEILSARIEHVTQDCSDPAQRAAARLTGQGKLTVNNGQSRVGVALLIALQHAGLADQRDLRPTSLTAYAGRVMFERTGRIEDAARVLGHADLNCTARLIGYDWESAPLPWTGPLAPGRRRHAPAAEAVACP